MQLQNVLLAAGSNSGGQLGLGHYIDSHALQPCKTLDRGNFPPDGYNIIDLSSGANHTVALLQLISNDEVQLWVTGSGREGQLGRRSDSTISAFKQLDLQLDLGLYSISDTKERNEWRPTLIGCGWDSTFVALRNLSDETQNDILLVLGKNNDFGQLGVGQSKTIQAGIAKISLSSNDSKDNPMRIRAIACGLRHTLVLCNFDRAENEDVSFKLFGWGAGRHGQLGLKAAVHWKPVLIDEWESTGKGSLILEAGKEHTIVHDGGRMGTSTYSSLYYLGSNRQGEQIVCNDITDHIEDAGCTWNATLVLHNDRIKGSGSNSKGQLGQPVTGPNGIVEVSTCHLTSINNDNLVFKQLTCGSEHVLALCEAKDDSSAQVWGWGWNEHGNLAQNDEQDRHEPVVVWPTRSDALSNYQPSQIWAGCGTTFVLLAKKQL